MPQTSLADVTYYIKPTGSNGDPGTSFNEAWATITHANANLPQPNNARGNVIVYIEDKTTEWDAFPNPATAPADGKRYRFIALRFAGVPRAQCMLPDAEFTGTAGASDALDLDHISVTGFTINGGVSFDSTATADSLSYSALTGGVYVNGADDCAVVYNSIDCSNGDAILIANGESPPTLTLRFSFSYNTVTGLGEGSDNESWMFGGGPWDSASSKYNIAWDTLIERNRMFWNIRPSAAQASAMVHYNAHFTIFRHNYFDITNYQQNPVSYPVWRFRNGGYAITMRGDTIINRGPSTGDVRTQCCDTHLNNVDRISRITLDSVYVLADYATAFTFYSAMDSATVQYCVFSSATGKAIDVIAGTKGANQAALDARPDNVKGYNVFNHNTLFAGGTYSGVVDWLNTEQRWHSTAHVVFTNNIIAGTAAEVGTCSTPIPKAVFWPKSNTGEIGYFVGKLTSNNNLFYIPSRTQVLGDHSIAWFNQGNGISCSRPGDNSTWEIGDGSAAWTAMDNDSLSVFGLPAFNNGAGGTGSYPGVRFVPALGTTSAARGIGTSASDAGAVAFYGEPQIALSRNLLDLTGGAQSFDISNTGTGTLTVTITSSDSRLIVDDYEHSVSAGATVSVSASVSGCDEDFVGYLTITSNDRDRPTQYIAILTECGGGAPP